MGADAAMEPMVEAGYFMRNQAASMPAGHHDNNRNHHHGWVGGCQGAVLA